ncbi:MAG TPA: VOC family protein [Sphingomonas sp.]
MPRLALVSLLVPDYDEALAYYAGRLGFELVEDVAQPEQGKRWVVIRPPGAPGDGAAILLARAATPEQAARIGDQAGGRVFLFLHTDDFARDYARFTAAGVDWVRPPAVPAYGAVAVFRDPFGNLWDLVQPAS